MSISAASTTCIADPETAQLALPPLSHAAVFLDVDGTLLDLKPDPRDVISHAALREMLLQLRTGCGGALALISGRAISDLDRIFSPLRLPTAGAHGAQLRIHKYQWELDCSFMDQARQVISTYAERCEGLLFEDKGASLAIHYRARPELEGEIEQMMSRLCQNNEIVLQRGKQVLELRPAICDKGTAIAAFMSEQPFKSRCPVFFGDDLTDEAGFAYVNSVEGMSVRIGASLRSQAQLCIVDISTLLECLSLWVERST
jgi:trehalose 6-phosphate phosphatase